MRSFTAAIFFLVAAYSQSVLADGPADNVATAVRPIPPPGISIEEEDRESLQLELEQLKSKIADLQKQKKRLTVQKYLPDVEIFSIAVERALQEDGFFDAKDVSRARDLLKEGIRRADALEKDERPFQDMNRSLADVRGFRSKIDGSVQPYGVVSNLDGVNPTTHPKFRADVWCRGRSEKGLELQFLATRMTSSEPLPAPGVIMIHPFGRYCNANKLAGEVDTLEALEHALQEYSIDPKRVAIRGFSMGGAAAWHLAVHYPDKWFAANPGAGFAETPEFLKVFQSEEVKPYRFEKALWQMYDCPIWARNLRMLPTVAYSGAIDKQKQAADIMAAACWNLPERERFELAHIVAPNVAHKFDPTARIEVEKRLAAIDAKREQNDAPEKITFTTTTLKYNSAHWVTIHALEEHWKPATIKAQFSANKDFIRVTASNVKDFSIHFPADQVPANLSDIYVEKLNDVDSFEMFKLSIKGNAREYFFASVPLRSDRSWGARIRRDGDTWEQVSPIEPASELLVKKHDLQGPIDDAFMGPFIFVKPTSEGRHGEVDRWVDSEFTRAVREWRRQMRGDVTVITSEELKPEDIAKYNLILWGDPKRNPTIAKVLDQLPLKWEADRLTIGTQKFDSRSNVPVMIYPNPLNRDRYVVINSSFTYREYDYLNNARQVPKLPDWAVIDLSEPPSARWPGKIAAADFFGEAWEVKPASLLYD
jgi:pimeloyl-ACP methyl ester carboxylesterase